MTREPMTKAEMMENALREIASQGCVKGGEWASDKAFDMLDYIETRAANAPVE